MDYEKIAEFYQKAVSENKLDKSLSLEAKNISTESDLKKFIEQKLLPIAKNMGYDFSAEELIQYEKHVSKLLSEEDLEQISGGINIKTWVIGGALSLTAILGTGFTLNTASAESATPISDSSFTQVTQYVSTDETSLNDDSTPDVADTTVETPSDDITLSSSTYTTTTDQDDLSSPDIADTTAENPLDDITLSSSTYTATTVQDDLSSPDIADTTAETPLDDITLSSSTYTATTDQDNLLTPVTDTAEQITTEVQTEDTTQQTSVTGKGILRCNKIYDDIWDFNIFNEDSLETKSCEFIANDDFDFKKFFSEAAEQFSSSDTFSVTDFVSSMPNLTLTEISVIKEKGTLSCEKKLDDDRSFVLKEGGYIETKSCNFSANDDFDFKQFFSEASEQFSSSDTFSVTDFVSSMPNLTLTGRSVRREKGTLSCEKNSNSNWSLVFKKEDGFSEPESCKFSANDDFDLKKFFSEAAEQFSSSDTFSVKDFVNSSPNVISNEEMKKIETEFGLKILENLPNGYEDEKFLELPQKADLSENEQEIYDEIESVVENLKEEAKKDTSNISDQLKIAKAIYEWIANNIEYTEEQQANAFDVFKSRYGICRGYAHLTNLMMRIAGIPSLYIGSLNGSANEKGHAFSAVYISDDTPERSGWTVLDSTWASPEFKNGTYEQNLFEQNESDSAHTLNEKFKDLTAAANEDIPWGYESEIEWLLRNKTATIEENNLEQINEEISKQLLEINSKPEYEDVNKLSEIKIQINPDDKANLEETRENFLSRLKLIVTMSEEAKSFIAQKNEKNLQKEFPTAYNPNITCKDANEKILLKKTHSIQHLSTEIYDIDLSKDIHPRETETGLVYSLSGHEEDASILLFGNPDMEPLENVEIPEEVLSYDLPIRIGSGIKSLILHGNPVIDTTDAWDLESIDTTDSNKYITVDGNLYVKNPDGSPGNLIQLFRKNGKVGNISYHLQLSDNGKEVKTISISSYGNDILENVTFPSELTKYNVLIQIGYGIKSLILHGNEEIDITNAFDLDSIDTTDSSKYITVGEALYTKNPDGSPGDLIRNLHTKGQVGNISYYLLFSDNGKEVKTIIISNNSNDSLENVTLPSEITKYNVPIQIEHGIKSIKLTGNETIELSSTDLDEIDTTDSKKYIAEDGVLYERTPNGTKGSQVAIFNQEVDKGDFKYLNKLQFKIICGKNPAEPLKDFHIPSDLIDQSDYYISIGPNIESLALTGNEEVSFERAEHLKELDISESDIYVIHEGKLGHKQDEYSPYEIPLPEGVKIIDKKQS